MGGQGWPAQWPGQWPGQVRGAIVKFFSVRLQIEFPHLTGFVIRADGLLLMM